MISRRPTACSRQSLEHAEPLAGTASTARGYLLVEHGGPWGAKALETTPFPGDDGPGPTVGEHLLAATGPHGVTPLLVRRHGARPGLPDRFAVTLAVLDPAAGPGTAVTTTLTDPADLRALDVDALVADVTAGRVPAGFSTAGPLFLVCTHARRDACCAELGRPLATVLTGLAPEATWESSHLGGHRLAATVLTLPDGVVHGRVDPDDALALVSAQARGDVLPHLARGRAVLPPPVQVAEVALRHALAQPPAGGPDGADGTPEDGATGDAAGDEAGPRVRLLDTATHPGSSQENASGQQAPAPVRHTSRWSVGEATWRVVVDTSPGTGPARSASCDAEPTPPPDIHEVVEVTDVDAAGRGAHGWDDAHEASAGDAPPNDAVVAVVSALAPGTALDVACGTGRHSVWLSGNGWATTGLDFSRAGLDRGRERAAAAGVDVDWVLGDARVWLAPTRYDLVLMAFVHLPGVLARAADWLRPGGHLVVVGHSVRNHGRGVGGPSDVRLLHDPDTLRRAASTAGLEVLRCDEVERPTAAGPAVDTVLLARAPSD